jgi:intraflagellar transport protein 172
VVVEEGRGQRLAYTLDEGLVEFGTALQDGDLNRAFKYLESINKNGQK